MRVVLFHSAVKFEKADRLLEWSASIRTLPLKSTLLFSKWSVHRYRFFSLGKTTDGWPLEHGFGGRGLARKPSSYTRGHLATPSNAGGRATLRRQNKHLEAVKSVWRDREISNSRAPSEEPGGYSGGMCEGCASLRRQNKPPEALNPPG